MHSKPGKVARAQLFSSLAQYSSWKAQEGGSFANAIIWKERRSWPKPAWGRIVGSSPVENTFCFPMLMNSQCSLLSELRLFPPRVNYEDMWCSSNFWVCGRNPMVWPYKWNLFSSTFAWYHLLFNILQNEILGFFSVEFCSLALLRYEGLTSLP